MKTVFRSIAPFLAAGLIAAGCKDKAASQSRSGSAELAQPVAPAPEAARTPDTTPKAKLDGISRALTKHELESATVGLVNLGLSGAKLTDAERVAYQSSMRNLQAQLAEAAARNDPKANELIQLLKTSHGK